MSVARFIGVAALLTAMGGCTGKDSLPLSPRQIVPGQVLLDVREVSDGNMRIQPARSGCGESIAPVKVSVVWDVTGFDRIADHRVLLGVMDAGGRWKTFASSTDAIGRLETGEWVLPGTTFFLVDARTKRVLAQAAFLKGVC